MPIGSIGPTRARVLRLVARRVGAVTGRLIAWDQLALWSVTVGVDRRGVLNAGDSEQARFVIVDGREVPLDTFRFWVMVHLLLLPVVCAGAAAVAVVRRRNSASVEQPALTPGSP
jgi:hypothetical protein